MFIRVHSWLVWRWRGLQANQLTPRTGPPVRRRAGSAAATVIPFIAMVMPEHGANQVLLNASAWRSSARRAVENSPAIHRWDPGAGRNESQRDDRNSGASGADVREPFCRPSGTFGLWTNQPSDKSPGYFRAPLRDRALCATANAQTPKTDWRHAHFIGWGSLAWCRLGAHARFFGHRCPARVPRRDSPPRRRALRRRTRTPRMSGRAH